MAIKIPHIGQKDAIIAVLLRCAREARTIYYGELGREVDIPARGPWKAVLDEIAREETASGRPDITFLVISKQTGLPGQIGLKPAKRPTIEQRRIADEAIRRIFAYYKPVASTHQDHRPITTSLNRPRTSCSGWELGWD